MTSQALVVAARRKAAARIGCSYERYEANLAANLKWCRGCRGWHDRSEFAPAPAQFDGLAALCRPARRLDRDRTRANARAREAEVADRAAEAAESVVVARFADGWWPAPLDPWDEQTAPREWPTWSVAGLVEQLVFFAADKACVGVDPEVFFPEDLHGNSEETPDRVRHAKRICATCPEQDDCLTAALRRNDRHGVFGGLTAKERMAIVNREFAWC